MKVRDVIRDLGSEVRVQLYKATESGYDRLFLRAYPADMLRGHADDKPWISVNMDKEVDCCSYSTVTKGDGFETFCDIYLKAEPAVVETESDLDAFFKKLDPDAYVYLDLWYGDRDVNAGEFIRIGLSGAEYSRIKKEYKSLDDLFNSLEITSIANNQSDKAIALDCKRRTDK